MVTLVIVEKIASNRKKILSRSTRWRNSARQKDYYWNTLNSWKEQQSKDSIERYDASVEEAQSRSD